MALTSYTIVRAFPAPPERLWRGVTDAAELAAWVWGANATGVRAAVDLRVGA